MNITKNEIKLRPEIIKEIKSSELELENRINKYRFFLFTFFSIINYFLMYQLNLVENVHLSVGLPIVLIFYLLIYFLHRKTKSKEPINYLKYITVAIDYFIVFAFAFLIGRMPLLDDIGIDKSTFLVISSITLITINGLSALRYNLGVIAYSSLLGLGLNLLLQYLFEAQIIIMAITSIFIVVSGFLNVFISGFIFRSYAFSYQLNATMKELENANKEVVEKNSEINSMNDELKKQNEHLHLQNEQISKQQRQIVSSIEYASRIQSAILATNEEIKEVVPESIVIFKPRDIVSGDFYWFKKANAFAKDYHIFAAVDCTGHGVPGAFMSMLGISLLNKIANEFYTDLESHEILNYLRDEVKKHLHQDATTRTVKDGMDIALCVLDYEKMELQFSGANSPLYIIRFNNNSYSTEIEEVLPDRMPIGVYVKEKPSFSNHKIKVNKGDLLYVFSDGVTDQFGGEKGEKFKKKQFKALLLENAQKSLDEQKTIIEDRIAHWKGDKYKQTDDITIIGVKV